MMLRHPPSPLTQPSFYATHRECKAAAVASPAASASVGVPREFGDIFRPLNCTEGGGSLNAQSLFCAFACVICGF